MIEIAICDDEKVIRDQITELIEKQKAECRIENFAAGEELLAAEKRFDVIFLDIQMEGMNGIETARAIRERNRQTVVIFITAVKEYVFEAFDVAAFHYLLKPILEEKFVEVFENAVDEVQKRNVQETPPIFIKTKTRNLTLRQKEILYIESRGKKVGIHTIADVIEIYASMNEWERQMGSSFYRSHRGYLVNMEHIAEYSNDMIDMSNGERVYLAKEKYKEFVKVYMRYLRNGGTAGV